MITLFHIRATGRMEDERGGKREEGRERKVFERQHQQTCMLTLCSLICERPVHCHGGFGLCGSEPVSKQKDRQHKNQHSTNSTQYRSGANTDSLHLAKLFYLALKRDD